MCQVTSWLERQVGHVDYDDDDGDVGQEAVLECKFDMEADSLYSVKWYRNEQEFYRFVPNDRPKLQIFPQDGIRVEADDKLQ